MNKPLKTAELPLSHPINLPAIIEATKPKPSEDDGEHFDWMKDESVIIREQPATACYFNPAGELVIRQRRWPDDDVFIYVAPHTIQEFLDKVTDACGVGSAP
jgi:hypothetical protein